MKNNECNIIQDLLPNYIEKLTSNETNIFIEEHLKNCENCNNVLKSMEKDFEKSGNMQEKEINYAKKFNKKYKKAKYTSLIIIYSLIIIILAFFGYKFIVFNSLANKMENYEAKTNYHIEKYHYNGKNFFKEEVWRKDSDYYNKTTFSDECENAIYLKNNEYYECLNGVWASCNFSENDIDLSFATDFYFIEFLKNELKNPANIFKFVLDNAYVNGKECYCIKDNSNDFGFIYYIEKSTGLLIRSEVLNGDISGYSYTTNSREVQSTLIDFKYKFDTVTDKDFVIDNFETYMKKEELEGETSFTNILNLKNNLNKAKNFILHIENTGNIGNEDGGTYYFKDNIEVIKGQESYWIDLLNKETIRIDNYNKKIQVKNSAISKFDEIYDTILANRRNGCLYTYVGKEKIDNFECHKITLTNEKEEYKYSIDIETGLIIKEEIKIVNFEGEGEQILRNYKYTFDAVTDEDIKEINLNDYADYEIEYL